MRQTLPLLLGLACLGTAGLAVAEDPPYAPEREAGTTAAGLAEELDVVLRDAVQQGLLSPSGPPSAVGLRGSSVLPRCEMASLLDFSAVSGLRRYQDIYALPIQGGDDPQPEEVELLTKAYLALGMSSEALTVMERSEDPALEALAKVANLIENRGRPDTAFFREVAECNADAELWLSIALLAEGREEGVSLLRANMREFRHLPLHLRANIATIAGSALSGLNEPTLARRMLATFSEEEVLNSSRLRFTVALLNMGEGNFEDEDIVRSFMLEPQFQQDALAALLRSDRSLQGAEKDLILEAVMREIHRTETESDVAASLGFALRELSAHSRYEEIAELSVQPALQGEAAQDAIRRHFVGALRRGLGSEERLENLSAVRALMADPGLLDGRDEQAELYGVATAVTARMGMLSLAEHLSEKSHFDDETAEYAGTLALRRADHEAAMTLADTYSETPGLALMAARSAIRAGDIANLRRYEARLLLDAETVLALIEEDAASGLWVVSEEIYDIASMITEEGQAERVDRVLVARHASSQRGIPPSPVSIAEVPDALRRSRDALASLARRETY